MIGKIPYMNKNGAAVESELLSRHEFKHLVKQLGLPTLDEFIAMAARGRIWPPDKPDPRTPTAEEYKTAKTALRFGRLFGYSEDDIAHFYNFRRRGEVNRAYAEYFIESCYEELPENERQDFVRAVFGGSISKETSS